MCKLFDAVSAADIFVDGFEPYCVYRSVEDFKNDIAKISGKTPVVKRYLPVDETGYVVVGSLCNERFVEFLKGKNIDIPAIEGKWEHFAIKTFGSGNENLLVCGSDERGTMWGIYDLCENYLHVDPLYFWTDNEPVPAESLIIERLEYQNSPKTFKFRGWFINDEDLLTEWKNGGGSRHIDYPFYHQVVHQEIMEKIIETALRLKQNLIIPASFIDIDNPAEENLVRMVTQRGMFISQHHVEPLGVSHFGWDNYWEKRGRDIPAQYMEYQKEFIEIWTHYVAKWAKYKNVIWQFGLRGRGDRPVWYEDANIPPSAEERGKLISSAIDIQYDIVKSVLGHDDFFSTSTLWMEGSDLHNEGFLKFPENTMVIFADNGPSQMLWDDFYNVKRDKAIKYGIYYHTAFWGDGPHLVQGNPVDKIYYNYLKAAEKGDTTYSVLNVANIREMVMGIRAVSEITWDIEGFDRNRFILRWCEREFGKECAKGAEEVYNQYYNAFSRLDSRRIKDQLLLMDGMVRQLGDIFIRMDYDFNGRQESASLSKNNKLLGFSGYGEMAEYYVDAAGRSIAAWKQAYIAALKVLPGIDTRRKQFFIDNVIVQTEIILGLYTWLYHLALATRERLQGNEKEFQKQAEDAIYALERLLMDRKKAEHGKWLNWYRGDKKLNVPDLLKKTVKLLD